MTYNLKFLPSALKEWKKLDRSIQKDKNQLYKTIDNILKIIQKGYFPKKTSSKARCPDCTYRNICV